VILDPEGEALTTVALYDNYGNKIRVQDPDGWVTYSDFGPLGLSAVYYPVLNPAPKENAIVHYRLGYQSKDKMEMEATFNKEGSLAALKLTDQDPLDRFRWVAQPNTAALMTQCYNQYVAAEVFDPNTLSDDPNLAKLSADYAVFEDSGDLFNRRITTACGKEVCALLQNGHFENVRYPANVWSQKQRHNPDSTLADKTVVNPSGTPQLLRFTTGQYGKPVLQEYPDGGSIGMAWDMFGSVSHADDNRVQGYTGDLDQVADQNGNVRQIAQGNFTGSFDYTSDGRPKHIVVKRQGTTVYDVEYRYDNGRLDEILWFGRLVVKYQRDGRGNPVQIIYSFDGSLIDTMTMGSTFDAENRPSSFNLSGAPCAFGWNGIQRDGRGFITGAVETFLDQTRYLSGSYDPMGRLLSWGWQGCSWQYGFDFDGNMTSDGQHNFSNTGMLLSGRNDGRSLSWDKNGQLLTNAWDTPLNFSWDYDGRLMSAGDYNVYYNPLGIRTQMTGPLTDTGFFADPAANDLVLWDNILNALKTCVIYDDTGNPMAFVNNSKIYFLVHGNNRDVRLVISEDKTLESYYTYSPYGQIIPGQSNEGGGINPFGAFSYMRTPWDDYYVKARYYSPALRIFYSADPVWGALSSPQEVFPRHQYCINNPVNFIDPTGEMSLPEIEGTTSTQGAINAGVGAYDAANRIKQYSKMFLSGVSFQNIMTSVVVDMACEMAGGQALNFLGGAGGKLLNTLKEANSSGIMSYSNLRKVIQGKGVQAHHLIEQRFKGLFGGMTKGNGLSVALTKEEHQMFTNKWRDAIGYINDKNNPLRTDNAQMEDVINAAKKIYGPYPELLNALGL
jgi:RHS repeat-associated protein